MWDYDVTDPLWGRDGGIGLETLPLSAALRRDLRRWAAELTEVMWAALHDDEAPPAALQLDEQGQRLCERVRAELGSGYEVTYVSAR